MAPIDQVLAHREFVKRLARRLVDDPNTAEDVAQQTFLIALRGGPESETAARSWFAKVVRNVVINRRAAEAARKDRELARDAQRGAPAPHADLAKAETSAALQEALRKLDPIYHEVLWLRFYEELTPNEIAQRLGVGIETVRTRQKRGLQRLRDSLDRRHLWGLSLWLLMLRKRARPMALGAAVLVVVALLVSTLDSAARREPRAHLSAAALGAAVAPDSPPRIEQGRTQDSMLGSQRELVAPSSAPATEAAPEVRPPPPTGLTVEVSVTRPDGSPAGGAQIWIRRPDQARATQVAECDSAGRARLLDIPKQAWICASGEPFRESLLMRLDAPRFGQSAEKKVELELMGPTPPLAIRVVDESGQPLPQASIHIIPDRRPNAVDMDNFVAHRERFIAPGEHNGELEVRGLRPYMWLVSARAEGYAEACVRRHVRAEHTPNEVLLTLSPGRTLSGRVRFSDGRAAPGVLVSAAAGFPFEPRTTLTNEFGEYSIEQIPDAPLILRAFGRVDDEGFEARAKGARDQERWDATLEPGGLVLGEALWEDGSPIAGAELHLLHHAIRRVVTSDESGRFAFESSPPPPFEVALAHSDPQRGYRCVANVLDDASPLRLTAPRTPARLEGVLRVDEREQQRPLTLWARALDWDEDREVPLDPATRAFVLEAAPGRFELLVWEVGQIERFSLATVELAAGERLRQDFELERRGTLEVKGLDPELRGGRVVLAYPDERIVVWQSAAKGTSALLATFSVPQGRYMLRYESAHMVLELDSVCVTGGETEQVELRVGSRQPVYGTLQLPPDVDTAGARPWVEIRDTLGKRHFVSHFDPREQIEFEAHLEDGRYVLTATLNRREVKREFVVQGRATHLFVPLDR